MNALRTFVEKEVHDGEVRLETVLLGENLKVRFFQVEVFQDGVCALGMYDLAEVFALHGFASVCQDPVARVLFCGSEVDSQSGLLDEESED